MYKKTSVPLFVKEMKGVLTLKRGRDPKTPTPVIKFGIY